MGGGLTDFSGEIAYTYAIVHVTDLGQSRPMDITSPARLFQFGWFAFGATGPGAWVYAGVPIFGHPIWIEFENQWVPDYTTMTFLDEIYTGFLRYEMQGTCEAEISFWHV